MEEGKEKNGRGAPTKYKEEYNDQAYKLCLLGCTDQELADFFEVVEDTINEWKKKYPEFSVSISLGKEKADMEVAQELYKGCKDRIVIEQQAIKVKCGIHEEKVEIVEVEKVLPADFRNQQFWLKNRKSNKWRDKQDITIEGAIKTIVTGIDPPEGE